MTGEFLTNFKTFTNLYILLRNREKQRFPKKGEDMSSKKRLNEEEDNMTETVSLSEEDYILLGAMVSKTPIVVVFNNNPDNAKLETKSKKSKPSEEEEDNYIPPLEFVPRSLYEKSIRYTLGGRGGEIDYKDILYIMSAGKFKVPIPYEAIVAYHALRSGNKVELAIDADEGKDGVWLNAECEITSMSENMIDIYNEENGTLFNVIVPYKSISNIRILKSGGKDNERI